VSNSPEYDLLEGSTKRFAVAVKAFKDILKLNFGRMKLTENR